MTGLVYKIAPAVDWSSAEAAGILSGSADDRRDGFIHLSTADQLGGTIARHFAGMTDLVLIAIDPEALGESLRWEPSRGGDLFPHHYGRLPLEAVRWVRPLGDVRLDLLAEAG